MVSYPTGYAAITGGLIESFQLKLHAADVASLKCAIQRLELFKGVDSAWSLRYTRTCYNILLAFYLSLSLSPSATIEVWCLVILSSGPASALNPQSTSTTTNAEKQAASGWIAGHKPRSLKINPLRNGSYAKRA